MAVILELTSTNRVLAKAEPPEKLLLRDVLLGEIKDKPLWWYDFQLESLSGAWISEDFRRFQGHLLTKAEDIPDVPGRQRMIQTTTTQTVKSPFSVGCFQGFGRSLCIPKDNEDNDMGPSRWAAG